MTDDRPTKGRDYTRRLARLEGARWKRTLGVQRLYRNHLRRLRLGFVLDVGCGIGRNLLHLDGYGVGVDHNADSVAAARERGVEAYTSEDFQRSDHARARRFESLLCAHVLEHMTTQQGIDLISTYLPFISERGRVALITPQEAGFRSDSTHVEFVDDDALSDVIARLGLIKQKSYSFPFPRPAGGFFKYNEFVAIASVG